MTNVVATHDEPSVEPQLESSLIKAKGDEVIAGLPVTAEVNQVNAGGDHPSAQASVSLKCDICQHLASSVQTLVRHTLEKHELTLIQCAPDCSFTYTTNRIARLHRHRKTQLCTRY